MHSKPPVWSDILLAAWVVVVGVIYYGGYFIPSVGALTSNASAFYALMLLISVLVTASRYLRRSDIGESAVKPAKPDSRTPNFRSRNKHRH